MRILLAWEIGRNYGHAATLADLARVLVEKQRKKAEIFFVLQSPGAVLPYVEGLEYRLLQAPYTPPGAPKRVSGPKGQSRIENRVMLTYADELREHGYEDAQTLAGMVRAWRDLYAAIKPDIIIAQAAPTALLASKGLKIKTVNFGSSHDVPAKAVPMPLPKPSETINTKLIVQREEEVLRVINKALEMNSLKPVQSVAEMLATDAEFITVFEEFDHYRTRSESQGKPPKYCGQFFSLDNGADIAWNKKSEKKILVTLRPDKQLFEFITVLAACPKSWDIIVSAPGLVPEVQKAFEQSNIRIATSPIKIGPLLKDCSLGISHATQGIGCAFALSGVPQMLLPVTIEQLTFAKALGRNQLGRGLAGRYGEDKITELLNILLNNTEYTESAKAFAKKHKGFKPENIAGQIADEIIALASAPVKTQTKAPAKAAGKTKPKGK